MIRESEDLPEAATPLKKPNSAKVSIGLRLRGQRTPLDQRIKKGHPRIESISVRGFFLPGPSTIIIEREG